jgi:hypothetical protein
LGGGDGGGRPRGQIWAVVAWAGDFSFCLVSCHLLLLPPVVGLLLCF